jgi:hypothetical protein
MRPDSTEENGGLEMSCQRCGNVLATELAEAMVQLVCEQFVIEGRYCHCDDGEDPVHTNLLRRIVVEVISEEGREPTKPEWRLQ